jgi:hypothetical protein
MCGTNTAAFLTGPVPDCDLLLDKFTSLGHSRPEFRVSENLIMVAPSTSQALRYDSAQPIQETLKQRPFTSHISRDDKAGPAPAKRSHVTPRQSDQNFEELATAESFKKIGSDKTCKRINGDSRAPSSSEAGNSHGRPGAAPHTQEACLFDEAVANHNGDVDARAGSPLPAPQTGLVRVDRQTPLHTPPLPDKHFAPLPSAAAGVGRSHVPHQRPGHPHLVDPFRRSAAIAGPPQVEAAELPLRGVLTRGSLAHPGLRACGRRRARARRRQREAVPAGSGGEGDSPEGLPLCML